LCTISLSIKFGFISSHYARLDTIAGHEKFKAMENTTQWSLISLCITPESSIFLSLVRILSMMVCEWSVTRVGRVMVIIEKAPWEATILMKLLAEEAVALSAIFKLKSPKR